MEMAIKTQEDKKEAKIRFEKWKEILKGCISNENFYISTF